MSFYSYYEGQGITTKWVKLIANLLTQQLQRQGKLDFQLPPIISKEGYGESEKTIDPAKLISDDILTLPRILFTYQKGRWVLELVK